MEGGRATLSDVYQSAKKLLLNTCDCLERLERLDYSASSDLSLSLSNDISQIQSLCVQMDRFWCSIAAKSQRDLWKRVKKTSLMNQYVYRKFSQHYKAIIGADFVTKELQVDDSSLYRFGIQQDKKGSIADLNDHEAFPFVLLGNKVDVDGGNSRKVTEKKAREWCASRGNLPYFETFAKEGYNIEDAFLNVAKIASENEHTQDIYFPGISETVLEAEQRDKVNAASRDTSSCASVIGDVVTEGMRLVCGLIVVIVLLNLKKGESRRSKSGSRSNSFVNCRAHSASLADYGGVGDGKTSNTKAFENAIRNLSQYEELVMEKHQTQRHLKMQ
ncbi:hypothetical protein Ahy_A07g034267 isoform B [Arachis hypogaea]|uniref:Uncharacterized protein n=1 Tax=Arachis hypogaea TaxID=3818 RepID=A0A445CBH6_ARAHY|nr:hypothetical protein Ahy_A07g034267 isoform B [Arachis hypogaea]